MTIVVTAAITLVVNASLKWLWASLRNKAAQSTITTKIKATFTPLVRGTILDLTLLVPLVWFLREFTRGDGTPSRTEILLAVGAVLALLINLLSIVFRISIAIVRRRS